MLQVSAIWCPREPPAPKILRRLNSVGRFQYSETRLIRLTSLRAQILKKFKSHMFRALSFLYMLTVCKFLRAGKKPKRLEFHEPRACGTLSLVSSLVMPLILMSCLSPSVHVLRVPSSAWKIEVFNLACSLRPSSTLPRPLPNPSPAPPPRRSQNTTA